MGQRALNFSHHHCHRLFFVFGSTSTVYLMIVIGITSALIKIYVHPIPSSGALLLCQRVFIKLWDFSDAKIILKRQEWKFSILRKIIKYWKFSTLFLFNNAQFFWRAVNIKWLITKFFLTFPSSNHFQSSLWNRFINRAKSQVVAGWKFDGNPFNV